MIPTLVKLRFNLCLFCCMFVLFIILLWLFSHSVVSNSLWLHGLQHTRLPRPSLSPGVYSSSCPLSRWYHPTTSSSVALFSSCHQSFSESKSFPRIGSSHQVAKVLELQLQHQSFQWIFRVDFLRTDWFDLLLSKGLLKVFSNTTVQKYQFLGSQPS